MPDINIAVTCTSFELASKARAKAAELRLNFLPDPTSASAKNYRYLLLLTPDYLGLLNTAEKKSRPFYLDFLSGKIHYRRHTASRAKELIAKAINIKPSGNPTIVDATAGWGRDSFILASLGYRVTLLERSRIVYALLQDALQRASKDKDANDIVARLTLIHKDAGTWLREAKNPDIIYLDPMFPEKQKSAKAKRDLQILQDIIGKDEDSDTLFTLALHRAGQRLIVKRPRHAPPLKGLEPTYCLHGSSSRFDIYLTPV